MNELGAMQRQIVNPNGHRYQVDFWHAPSSAHNAPLLIVLDGVWVQDSLDAFLQGTPQRAFHLLSVSHSQLLTPQGTRYRAYDYTPLGPNQTTVDPRVPDWQCGGAPAFHNLLWQHILPQLCAATHTEFERIVLYGHSYAGLFCVWEALQASTPAQYFLAASPSLWWHWPWAMTYLAEHPLSHAPPRHLRLWVGEHEQWHPQPMHNHQPRGPGQPTAPLAERFAAQLTRLRPNWTVHVQTVPHFDHGRMLAHSAQLALQHTQAMATS